MLIAVVTPLFPIQGEPYRGKPIYKTVLSLQRHADVKVFCPAAVYPPSLGPKYRYRRVDRAYKPEGVDVEYLEYRVFPLFSRPLNGKLCAAQLRNHLEKVPYDLILSYWLYPEGYACVDLGRERRKPVIVGSRGSDLRRIEEPLTRLQVRHTMTHADRVLTVSEELRQQALAFGIQPEKVHAIRNGCDRNIFHYRPLTDARRELSLPDRQRIILFVGWLSPPKGTLVLLKAFRQLAAEDPSLHLVFIGEGDQRHIESFAESAGLQDRIRLTGACASREVASWMAGADVLCLPSYSEGCPNVVLEAMTIGCPVVASNVGGIPEIMTDDCGTMVPDHEPETLALALRKTLDRTWDRERMSRRLGRGWDQVADETFAICRDVVRTPIAAQAPAIRIRPKRPKIAVVTPYFPIAEEPYRGHSAFQTLRRMRKYAEIEVICPITVYPKTKWLHPSGYRYRRADLSYRPPDLSTTYFEYPALPVLTRPINGLTCARHLKRYLAKAKPDVILNYWVYPEGFAAVHLGRKWRIPVIVGSIGSDILRTGDPLSFALMRHTLKEATGVITVSEDLRRNAIALGVLPERVTAVLNGCDLETFHPADLGQARRELGVATDAELLLYIGWLSPTKGLVELVDSIAALARTRPRLKLALIGEGYYQQWLEKQAAAAGILDRIVFLGSKTSPEVARWLAACDVFCLPSYSEGCPNVVVEAISSGRPVVATHVGGVPELIAPDSGLLVPPRNTEALTKALDSALTRDWNVLEISRHWRRDWDAAALETYEVCCRAAGL